MSRPAPYGICETRDCDSPAVVLCRRRYRTCRACCKYANPTLLKVMEWAGRARRRMSSDARAATQRANAVTAHVGRSARHVVFDDDSGTPDVLDMLAHNAALADAGKDR